jgi:hypothetical protein
LVFGKKASKGASLKNFLVPEVGIEPTPGSPRTGF